MAHGYGLCDNKLANLPFRGMTGAVRFPISVRNICASKRIIKMSDTDHKHGEMDITEQEKTFDGFIRFTVNGTIICIAIVIFLAIFAI
jgi:hypothetical protein